MSLPWTPPRHVDGTDAETGQFNSEVVDNLRFLNQLLTRLEAGIIVAQTATVATGQSPPASFGDCATVGPAVTLTTGARVLLELSATIQGSSGAEMSVAISGATTVAAGTYVYGSTTQLIRASRIFYITGLTPGSNTFTAKYRGSTGTVSDRRIMVRAL